MRKIVVEEENNFKRLDIYLTELIDESRNFISKNIKSGKILVNDSIVKSGYSLRTGDVISIGDLSVDTSVEAEDIPIDILYEDNDIIVVNKQSGMVVHPGNGNHSHTLVNALMGHTDDLSDEGGSERCGIVHRIDKDTSGILLIAKTNEAHRILSDGFKNKTIDRKYIALVHGVIDNNKGKINAPIGRSKTDRKKMCITDENSKNAVTNFVVLERFHNATLVECILETGRTHQIRVHMEYIGHPVVNDPVYGRRKKINDYGQMLHAAYLGFEHPITKKYMEFETKPESEFEEIVDMFRNS
ncbi:MAG: RluA family pseudouridine synthase [Bacilli bacterium]|jgi:23S rRNA pseudouridine1911/1915/1917 synthase|nr:RluA family pseudouridine synthase [Bacilli bacterium]